MARPKTTATATATATTHGYFVADEMVMALSSKDGTPYRVISLRKLQSLVNTPSIVKAAKAWKAPAVAASKPKTSAIDAIMSLNISDEKKHELIARITG